MQVEVEATNIPQNIEVSIEGLGAGVQIRRRPGVTAGATLVTDAEVLVVNVTAMISQEALDAELAEAEAEAGIEHEEARRSPRVAMSPRRVPKPTPRSPRSSPPRADDHRERHARMPARSGLEHPAWRLIFVP